MANEERLLKRRELIKRIAMAGTVPSMVAVIASTSINEAAGSPPSAPAPVVTPEPTMLPVLAGLGAAVAVAAKLRNRGKTEEKAGSDSDSNLPES